MSGLIANITKGIGKRLKTTFHNPYKKLNLGWLKMKLLKNSPSSRLRTIDFLDHPITFIKRDDFLHSLKEIFIDEIYFQQLGQKPLILDCGANIGLSVIYLKGLFPDARIIAFEPDEENFNLLEKNIASFGLTNIELRKEAVWIENTNINFSASGTLGSKIEKDNNRNTSIVKARRLKELLQSPVDFLKLDIEGSEYEVLKDVAGDIGAAKNIFIEYHGNFNQNKELTEIFEMLVHNGFCFYIKEASPVHPTPFSRYKTPIFDLQLNIFCFRPNNERTSE